MEYFDEWKKEDRFIDDVMMFLDNVLEYFIEHAPDPISRAKYSAQRERSVGLGTLGSQAYFQRKGIAFDSAIAKALNRRIFEHIHQKCELADQRLCEERGPCPDAKDAGIKRRFSHWMALAPNASSSLIVGNTSPSIEPRRANVYRQDTISGAHIVKNRYLVKALDELQMNTDEVWADIIAHDGSVQHIEAIPEAIRAVFKTAQELDQRWLIELAADRQTYIDQGQSLNLFFPADVSIAYLHACHFLAWKRGLKSLYYCRSDKLRKADRVGVAIERRRIEDDINMREVLEDSTCLACEG